MTPPPIALELPWELRQLIRRMANENPTWGQERIASELLLKVGLRASPRTVRRLAALKFFEDRLQSSVDDGLDPVVPGDRGDVDGGLEVGRGDGHAEVDACLQPAGHQ